MVQKRFTGMELVKCLQSFVQITLFVHVLQVTFLMYMYIYKPETDK